MQFVITYEKNTGELFGARRFSTPHGFLPTLFLGSGGIDSSRVMYFSFLFIQETEPGPV
jgi:hypothetical protein